MPSPHVIFLVISGLFEFSAFLFKHAFPNDRNKNWLNRFYPLSITDCRLQSGVPPDARTQRRLESMSRRLNYAARFLSRALMRKFPSLNNWWEELFEMLLKNKLSISERVLSIEMNAIWIFCLLFKKIVIWIRHVKMWRCRMDCKHRSNKVDWVSLSS